jgi:hypothetical protein
VAGFTLGAVAKILLEYKRWHPVDSPIMIPHDETYQLNSKKDQVPVVNWQQRVRLLTLAGHNLILNDGPEITTDE